MLVPPRLIYRVNRTKIPTGFLSWQADSKIYMEEKRFKNSQDIPEEEEQGEETCLTSIVIIKFSN